MEKIIKIGEKEVKLNNNVAWTMEYRDQFGKDIVPVITPLLAAFTEGISSVISEAGTDLKDAKAIAAALEGRSMDILLPVFQLEFVDVIINVLWAMAKAADETIEPPKRWVKQFDEFPLDVVVPEIYKLVVNGFVSSKNLERLESVKDQLKKLQPSH